MIEFLQAEYGDAIHIESNHHHILIDGGPSYDCISPTINAILESKEVIDLLVITHYDEDHIMGILDLFTRMRDDVRSLVKQIWFNGTKWGYHDKGQYLSSDQGESLSKELSKSGIEWKSDVFAGLELSITENCRVRVLSGGPIVSEVGDNYLSGKTPDWGCPMQELDKYNVSDKDLDGSPSNAASIIILLSLSGKRILLPGDATPSVLIKALIDSDVRSEDKLYHYDLVKLPHHGSYRNVSQGLLQIIACDHFVISTNGKKFNHPDKRTFLKFNRWAHHDKESVFHFHMNYFDDLSRLLGISDSDFNCFNFTLDDQRRW